MKILALVSRILLGLLFLVFGLNGFLNFIPHGPLPADYGGQFMTVLIASKYVLAISAIEVLGALLLLAGWYIPLGLVLLGPILVNILLYHLFMSPTMIAPGLVVTVLWLIVFVRVRSAFSGIFLAKVPA